MPHFLKQETFAANDSIQSHATTGYLLDHL